MANKECNNPADRYHFNRQMMALCSMSGIHVVPVSDDMFTLIQAFNRPYWYRYQDFGIVDGKAVPAETFDGREPEERKHFGWPLNIW